MPSRLMGTEQEFGIIIQPLNPSDTTPEAPTALQPFRPPEYSELNDLLKTAVPDTYSKLGISCTPISGNGFLSNGGRLYTDCGHPEYSTPEVRILDDLIASRLAGERIVHAIFETAIARGLVENALVYGNAADIYGNSFGYHENYLLDRRTGGLDLRVLAPLPYGTNPEAKTGHETDKATTKANLALLGLHLATRSIYCGAGGIRMMGSAPRFVIAQKAACLETTMDDRTVTNKPLVNLRDESEAIEQYLQRLHVTSGDPSSPWGTKMSLGTTWLVLDMIRHGLLQNLPFRFDTSNLYKVAMGVANDPTCRQTYRTLDGKKVTAINIQEEFGARALQLPEHQNMTPDDIWVQNNWEMACSTLKGNPLELTQGLWPLRLRYLVKKFGEVATWGDRDQAFREKLTVESLFFDKISPTRPQASRLEMLRRSRMWSDDMPPEDNITERITTAPRSGRAEQRARLIATGRAKGAAAWFFVNMDDGVHKLLTQPLR